MTLKARIAIAVIAVAVVAWTSVPAAQPAAPPLAAWNDGVAKRAIVEFVTRVTTSGSPDFVPTADRIATFDNDGTLWAEKPLPSEVFFVLARLHELAARDPSLKTKQPFKAALDGDTAYFHEQGAKAVVQLMNATHTGMSQEQFASEVTAFFETQQHPVLKRPFALTTYAPMHELLTYLRANGFETWICSGGTTDFMRVLRRRRTAFRPVGSSAATLAATRGWWTGSGWCGGSRRPARSTTRTSKPVSIDARIGKRPLFVAGNVGGSGDIAMMQYSRGRPGLSLQLLINHDDAEREFAYAEKDGFSLNAARTDGFVVASIRNDWKDVFVSK